MKRILITLSLAMVPFMAQADEYLYILSAKAKILTQPSFKASIVDRVSKGEKVVELAKNNNWFKVRYKGKEGWLSRLAVSPNPPMKKVTLLAEKDETLASEARRRASSMSTTAAVRGLRADERTRMSQDNVADYDALAMMEGVSVEDQEVWRFLEERSAN